MLLVYLLAFLMFYEITESSIINTGKWSEMSQVSIPEAVSSGLDMKILSISVAELATILVGCDIYHLYIEQ